MPDPNDLNPAQPAFPSIPGVPDPSRIEADRLGRVGSTTPSQSTNAPPPAIARLYNSLDGSEIIKMMTQQISAMLRRDRRLATNITFPRAMWRIHIDLVVTGREDPHVLFDLAGGHVELDENSVEYPQDPNKEVRISASEGQSYVDTPDDVREEHGINPPVARRHRWGSAETIADRSQRVADLPPEYQEGMRAVEQMERSDPMKARRLREALEGRPHIIVEESPMAKQSRVLSPHDNVEEQPRASAESQHPQELRGSRVRKDAIDPRSRIPSDPRFHLEGMKPILDAEGRAIRKDRDSTQSSQPSQLDPREIPSARPSASIKDDEGRPRGDMEGRAMAQKDRGAPPLNREVKMQPDSIEGENPDVVSSRQGAPEASVEEQVQYQIDSTEEAQARAIEESLEIATQQAAERVGAEMTPQSPVSGEGEMGEEVAPDPIEPLPMKGREE